MMGQKATAPSWFSTLLDYSFDAFVAMRADGVVTAWSKRAEELFGFDREEAIGAQLAELIIRPSERKAHLDGLTRYAKTGQGPVLNRRLEVIGVHKDGTELPVELTVTAFWHDGKADFVGFLRDLTEKKSLERRAIVAEKMASVGTLAAGVAHEINNPLTSIKANTETIAEEIEALAGASPPARLREVIEMLDDVRESVRRIRKIVQALRTFSHSATEHGELVDISHMFQQAVRLCMNEIRHRARLSLNFPEGTPLVVADDSRLVQVAVNLLVNSAQAIEAGDAASNEIRVTGGHDNGMVFFEVADSGTGMREETLKRAFDPFFTTKAVGEGTGLGLSICHEIITALDGSIEVRSEYGQGTVVRVTLPEPPLSSGLEVRSPERDSRTQLVVDELLGDILIVDDDRSVARSMGRLLRGANVQIETDPRVALERVRRGDRFDAIICDVMMPQMTGGKFYSTLSSLRPELAKRVLFVTGGAFSEEARGFLVELGVPVINKPIAPEKLRKELAALLER